MTPVHIGNATLYLGDCLDVLPGLSAELVLTDPPYGIGESSKKNATRGNAPFGGKGSKGRVIPPTDYGSYEWDSLPASALHIEAVMRSAPKTIIWGGNYFGLPAAYKWLVWDKINSGDFADCELAWTNLPGAVRQFRHMWNGMLRDSEKGYPRLHPTQKPIKLMEWCLSFVPDAKNILDPFMGSGTTGIACVNLGKSFIGIELDARYFDIACKRIEAAYAQGRLFV